VTDQYALFAEFYDHIVPYRQRNDVDFFVEMAQRAGGATLELGCGTGRVLVPVAKAGLDIVGLDLSEAMLDVCREKLEAESEDVQAHAELQQADMTDFELKRQFMLAMIPFRPFQHLIEIEQQVACLERVFAHLHPGGQLILDLFNPDLLRLTEERFLTDLVVESEFEMPDGRRVVRKTKTHSRDYGKQTLHMEFIHEVTHPDGKTETMAQKFPMRYFFRYEVEHLLARCGFDFQTAYSDYEGAPFGSSYPGELICIATKPA
jgi:ubiquinone/menaquinone biosynthesis C-methylase UbiE